MGAPRLTSGEYVAIKQLLGMGYDAIKISGIVGRARAVVGRVKSTKDYSDYKQTLKLERERARAKETPKQLPLDKPKKTKVDMKEDLTIKLNALIETVVTYKRYAALSSDKYSQWRWNNAIEHLEEARLWLKEAF